MTSNRPRVSELALDGDIDKREPRTFLGARARNIPPPTPAGPPC